MTTQLDIFLASYSRESRENTLCLRKLLLEIFPIAIESIDGKTGTITYSSPTARKDHIFAISLHMKHINLNFSEGAQLPDPARLLSGTGTEARHIKIKSEAETQNPALHELLKEAIKRCLDCSN